MFRRPTDNYRQLVATCQAVLSSSQHHNTIVHHVLICPPPCRWRIPFRALSMPTNGVCHLSWQLCLVFDSTIPVKGKTCPRLDRRSCWEISSVKSHMKPGVSLSSVQPSEQVMGPEYAEIELQDSSFPTSRFFHGWLLTGFVVRTFYSTPPRIYGFFLQRPVFSRFLGWFLVKC